MVHCACQVHGWLEACRRRLQEAKEQQTLKELLREIAKFSNSSKSNKDTVPEGDSNVAKNSSRGHDPVLACLSKPYKHTAAQAMVLSHRPESESRGSRHTSQNVLVLGVAQKLALGVTMFELLELKWGQTKTQRLQLETRDSRHTSWNASGPGQL